LTDVHEQACVRLEAHLPRPIRRAFHWARSPQAKLIRIPIGILCTLGGLLWFLPVLGLWMLPLGLILLAQDVPFLRRPVGRLLLRLLDRWDRMKERRRVSV
jgi:hypothetical protein